ncbi:hypothetical protein D0Z00_003484 [Geotrichum galactomycetum]|uniref:Uncharacterized protein n=1 Tax=Geotrichum galactomycetum TaxID=27317 RepID=A0ACB6V154_9ASCO|nr:hypothetical protein D0Z00_003484 [Geotrichum candidum]
MQQLTVGPTRKAILESGAARKDLVFVRDLSLKALTGVDAWHRPEPQPVIISIWLRTSVARAGSTDHLTYSLNYAVITRNVSKMVESSKFKSLEHIAERVAQVVLGDSVGGQWAKIQVKKPRALLRAEASEIIIVRQRADKQPTNYLANKTPYEVVAVEGEVDLVKIHKLRLVTIIGVNTIERMHKQNVILDLTLVKPANYPQFSKAYDFRKVVQIVTDHVEDSSYKTVEAFVTSIAEVVCSFGVEKVTVRAEKPSALTFADAAGVEVTRTRKWYLAELESGNLTSTDIVKQPDGAVSTPLFPDTVEEFNDGDKHIAFIAFGSNVGDSLAQIERSVTELAKRGIAVVDTSSIFQSDPMYVLDQPKFYNGVFKTETSLKPLELLDALKDIEYNAFQRVKEVENGPRSIDLDIILYDDIVFNQPPKLMIPHIGMLSRTFVLKPLTQLVPSTAIHPLTAETFYSHLEQITDPDPEVQKSNALKAVVPLRGKAPLVFDSDRSHTLVMGIVNVTPDSFSDGGKHYDEKDVSKVVAHAETLVAGGANILDIGGMSTRPGSGATAPSTEQEIARVVPVIKAVRAKFPEIVISIDTYRAQVAQAAVEAGADIINDISAGQLDSAMLPTAKQLNVPIILNHTRGTPETMTSLADYHYPVTDETAHDATVPLPNSDEAVIAAVAAELGERVRDAVETHGLNRWQIILDPGLGFAKNLQHNLAILRNLRALKDEFSGFPWLVAPSRKKFIGTLVTGKGAEVRAPEARVFGTAATITAAVQGGADIVRVHDVKEMIDVVRVADGIYRGVY